jgi:stearoyl-CoA desaturase (delta-9 desaturase)
MQLLSASSKNTFYLQIVSTLLTIAGFWIFDFTITSVAVIVLFYFLYSGVGISMTFHRYWTHKSFEFKSNIVKWVCTWFGLMSGRGSVIGWVHIHREHHAYADTEKDPHSPKYKGWRLFFPNLIDYGVKINRSIIREFWNKTHLSINRYYMLLILVWVLFLSLISIEAAYFAYIVPVTITQYMHNSFIYFGHKNNHTTPYDRDDSKNQWFYGYFLWGEGWHKNHHKNARANYFGSNWWQLDLAGAFIKLVKK